MKSRISGGLKAAHGTAQRQTWNLSQVPEVALCNFLGLNKPFKFGNLIGVKDFTKSMFA